DNRRPANQAAHLREWWLGSWDRAFPFKGIEQCSLLAADIPTCPRVKVHLQVVSGSQYVRSQVSCLLRFMNSGVNDARSIAVCPPQKYVRDICTNREGGDDHSFDQLMRCTFEQQPVFESSGLHLVCVADEVTRLGTILRNKTPFQSRWKARSTASA